LLIQLLHGKYTQTDDSAKRTPLAWADIGRAAEEASGEDEAEIPDGSTKSSPPAAAAASRPTSSQGGRPGTASGVDSKIAAALRKDEAAKRKRARAADREQVISLLMEARKQQSSARQAAELSDLLRMVQERKQLLRAIQDKKQAVERSVDDSRHTDRAVIKQQRDEWLRRERDEIEGRAELQRMLTIANDSDIREAYDDAHGHGLERDVKRLKLGVDIVRELESQLRVTNTLLEETRQRLEESRREKAAGDERESGLRALLNRKQKLPGEPASPGSGGSSGGGSSGSLASHGAVGRRASASLVDLQPAHPLRRSQTLSTRKFPITTYRLPTPTKSPPTSTSATLLSTTSGSISSTPSTTISISTPIRNGNSNNNNGGMNGTTPMTPPLTPSTTTMVVPSLGRVTSSSSVTSSPSSSQPSTPRRLSTASSSSGPPIQTVLALRVGPAPPDRPESASVDLYHTPNNHKLLPVWETIGGSALQCVLPPPYRASWAFDRAYWSADGFTLTPTGRAVSSASPGSPPATFCMQPFASNSLVCKDIGAPMSDRLWMGTLYYYFILYHIISYSMLTMSEYVI
jgi:hypothetical protein